MRNQLISLLIVFSMLTALMPVFALPAFSAETEPDGENAQVNIVPEAEEASDPFEVSALSLDDQTVSVLSARSAAPTIRVVGCKSYDGNDVQTITAAQMKDGSGNYDVTSNGLTLTVNERAKGANASYVLVTFNVEITVPAYTTYNMAIFQSGDITRNAKGTQSYWFSEMLSSTGGNLSTRDGEKQFSDNSMWRSNGNTNTFSFASPIPSYANCDNIIVNGTVSINDYFGKTIEIVKKGNVEGTDRDVQSITIP